MGSVGAPGGPPTGPGRAGRRRGGAAPAARTELPLPRRAQGTRKTAPPPGPARLVRQLSWTESEMPQKVRTKHVHGIHPYFGKFVPQLVDYFLDHDLKGARMICDPFMGSGTTLVQANARGIPSIGMDISKFNAMLCNVKIARYDVAALGKEVNAILAETLSRAATTNLDSFTGGSSRLCTDSDYLNKWFHPDALHALLAFKELIPRHRFQDVLKIILTRAARSSRMIAHYEVDYPKEPRPTDYYCLKHSRTCHPTKNAVVFLKRYCRDVVGRLAEFQGIRRPVHTRAMHGDSSTFDFSRTGASHVMTSPPYIGLIDYHEQHRYAYELLGIEDRSELEIGRRASGTGKAATARYKSAMSRTFRNVSESLRRGGVVVVIVNDRMGLYEGILHDAGLSVAKRLRRTVNRRSGRRATGFDEDMLVCRRHGDS